MRRYLWVLMGLALLFPFTASAQNDKWVEIAGRYRLQGAYENGENAYTGEMTINGRGSVYMADFTVGEYHEEVPLLRVGDVGVLGYRSEVCAPSAYTRLPDGRLYGLWLDRLYHDTVGVEILHPLNQTEGFAGRYRMEGVFGDMGYYEQEVIITVDENAVFTLSVDDGTGNQVPFGRGFAVGAVLGSVQTLRYDEVPLEDCGVWVAAFTRDGSYSARFIEDALGLETGQREG